MKKYEISEETLKGLLQYLSTRPYSEVYQGIHALQSLKEIGFPLNKQEDEEK